MSGDLVKESDVRDVSCWNKACLLAGAQVEKISAVTQASRMRRGSCMRKGDGVY